VSQSCSAHGQNTVQKAIPRAQGPLPDGAGPVAAAACNTSPLEACAGLVALGTDAAERSRTGSCCPIVQNPRQPSPRSRELLFVLTQSPASGLRQWLEYRCRLKGGAIVTTRRGFINSQSVPRRIETAMVRQHHSSKRAATAQLTAREGVSAVSVTTAAADHAEGRRSKLSRRSGSERWSRTRDRSSGTSGVCTYISGGRAESEAVHRGTAL
jgi:hypothetical protein